MWASPSPSGVRPLPTPCASAAVGNLWWTACVFNFFTLVFLSVETNHYETSQCTLPPMPPASGEQKLNVRAVRDATLAVMADPVLGFEFVKADLGDPPRDLFSELSVTSCRSFSYDASVWRGRSVTMKLESRQGLGRDGPECRRIFR